MKSRPSYTNIEKQLLEAAAQLPEPTGTLPISPVMQRPTVHHLHHVPIWRAAIILLVILCVGTTTALAASPTLRHSVLRFFTSGTTEKPPFPLEDPSQQPLQAQKESLTQSEDNIAPSVQTVGSLTLTQSTTLDAHFTTTYASSSDYLTLVDTPSGTPLFQTLSEGGTPVFYTIEDGILQEIFLEMHTLTTTFSPGLLPGVMNHDGLTSPYDTLQLPTMEFTVCWQQYGREILVDNRETDYRFDIESTYGVDLGNDYDGRFYSRAIPGRNDLIQVFFNFDGQMTSYQYPFLVDLTTGGVFDPLATVDLSDYPCITELCLSDDLTHATAMAGSDHDHLRKICVDLTTGQISHPDTADDLLPPVSASDCLIWFAIDDQHLFYAIGDPTCANGFLYDADAQTSTPLFTDAAQGYNLWDEGTFERYFSTIGGGYLLYHEGGTVTLLNLHDGSATLLENIPAAHYVHFFFNPDHTVLCISIGDEDPDSSNTERLCFLDMDTMEAWYFDRDLPESVSEKGHTWFSDYGYLIMAQHEETGENYLYLYEYLPR